MNTRKQIRSRISPLNPPELEGRRKRRELAGQHPRDDQTAYLDRSQVDAVEPLTDTALDQGELIAGGAADPLGRIELPDTDTELAELESLALLADSDEDQLLMGIEDSFARRTTGLDLLTDLELRAGETADPLVASDEGSTYIPPIDPPVVPGAPANAKIASGLGISALDEPYDESHHSSFLPDDDEVSARVREALCADSSTTGYADSIAIETRDGIVILRGWVDDLIDNDNLLAVASDVAGVAEVVDALRVRGMGQR